MKKIKILSRVLCLVLLLSGCGKSNVKASAPEEGQTPKRAVNVVGYMFASGDLLAQSAGVDFSKISHLNIAFLNPDASGTFGAVTGLAELTKKAHDNHVKILAAFAGGDPPAYLKEMMKADKRKSLVDGLLNLTRSYNLDGIDVDLEGDFVNEDYEAFVVELSAALKKENKLMTAAVATWNSAAYSDKALALFDLINIMAYDHTGPWRKDQPGPHSAYEDAVLDFDHWQVTRKLPAEKLILGLPFYGYGFGPDIAQDMSYGALVQTYPGAEKEDLWVLPGKGTFYYNGIPTIRKKVAFAMKRKAGGVMIWQLLGDAAGEYSLLNTIHKEIL
ncbi:Chitinase [Pedobacter sp. BAL39]|uniref:glycosyl hydrolase family 18 protein n=1 Tax=Pedobacter sp. BAL39 TaxID=391596 RepID=UPI00015599E2|nr:glycosyl hydrolase family 18 protein [Pedobacter sp. BAL39]EDM37619.1 Chitinase [Pedobacter sp. BAL39]